MRLTRIVLAVIVLACALVLQVSLITRLPLPGGVAPGLVLVVVSALSVSTGPLPGLLAGFAAGLALDVVPPAYHTIGRFALIYCLVGYFVGLAHDEVEDSALASFLAVAVGCLAGVVLNVIVGALLGDPRVTWSSVARVVPLTVLYDVVLSPFVLFVVVKLVQRRGAAVPERDPWHVSGRRP